MRRSTTLRRVILTLVATALVARAELPTPLHDELARAKYVYLSSARKDGSLSRPAEIWFLFYKGAVYVASPPAAWRVRRIKAGRSRAKIAVGRPEGPSFAADGAIVNEPGVHTVLFETFAKKYPEGWTRFEEKFRKGLEDGSRVLIRYAPR